MKVETSTCTQMWFGNANLRLCAHLFRLSFSPCDNSIFPRDDLVSLIHCLRKEHHSIDFNEILQLQRQIEFQKMFTKDVDEILLSLITCVIFTLISSSKLLTGRTYLIKLRAIDGHRLILPTAVETAVVHNTR